MKVFKIAGFFLALWMVFAVMTGFVKTNRYEMVFKTVSVNGEEITIETPDGNRWVFEDDGTWEIGNRGVVLMDDAGTPTVFDDVIVEVRR